MLAALTLNQPDTEVVILWAGTILSTLAHLHYGVVVVSVFNHIQSKCSFIFEQRLIITVLNLIELLS